jgi:hypothetical protein
MAVVGGKLRVCRLMCWFLDGGKKEAAHAQVTGVQKAPRHEVAGSWALAMQRGYGGLMPAPTSTIDVALAEFGLRVCTYGSSGERNRLLGGRWERTHARCAH